jgi:hypothetical protein
MLHVLIEAIVRTFAILVFVFVAMLLVDYVNVLTRGKFSNVMRRGRFRQYVSSSFLGSTPGCLGAFMSVSFYAHGVITFGAMFGGMVASCGDEAFVMLAAFPGHALILFGILFVMGVVFAWLSDAVGPLLGPAYGKGCKVEVLHGNVESCRLTGKELWRQLKAMSVGRAILLLVLSAGVVAAAAGVLNERPLLAGEHSVADSHHGWDQTLIIVMAAVGIAIVATSSEHYLREHILGHIVKKHLWKVGLWTFFALLVVGMGMKYWDLEAVVREHRLLVLLMAALVGLIPQSGPHLIFVTMVARGVVPFSVLLTSSISQEGHALLPLLSCSVRDALTVKGMKLILALGVGMVIHALGW